MKSFMCKHIKAHSRNHATVSALTYQIGFLQNVLVGAAENLILLCKGKKIHIDVANKQEQKANIHPSAVWSHGCPFTVRYYVVHNVPSTHISSVVGILLIIMRLIWHGLNNYLPASDWHSHKKGWVGLGEQMVTFHMTKLINQHAGTQVQHRRAAPHHLFHHLQGTNTWAPIVAPWGSACSSVPLCQGWWHQNFPSALPQDAEQKWGKKKKKKHRIKSAVTARPGKGCISDVKARDSHISTWYWTDKLKENVDKSIDTFCP